MIQNIEGFRLSPQQKHLWNIMDGEEMGWFYGRVVYEIKGELQLTTLQKTLENLTVQFENLRVTFPCLPGMAIPLQVIPDANPPFLETLDWQNLSDAESQLRLADLMQGPCQCSDERPISFTWIRAGERRSWLVVALSPLISDEASGRMLASELILALGAGVGQDDLAESSEDEGPVQYGDVSDWLNELLESEETAEGRAFWRDWDYSGIPAFRLPAREKKNQPVPFSVRESIYVLPTPLAALLADRSGDGEFSAEEMLLTCWQILLGRISGESRVVTGVVFNGRKYEELEGVIGLLEKNLPLTSQIEKDSSFQDILKATASTFREMFKYQEYFSWDQALETSDNRAPYIPYQFAFDKGQTRFGDEDLSLTLGYRYSCSDRFDLKLSVLETEQETRLVLRHDPSLYSDSWAGNLTGRFVVLLEALLNNCQQQVGNPNLLVPAEQERLVQAFNHTTTAFNHNHCLHHMFFDRARERPHNLALVFQERQASYQEVAAEANRIANLLLALGVAKGDLVAVHMNRSMEMIPALLAILQVGAAYVPIETNLPSARVTWLLAEMRIACIFTDFDQLEALADNSGQLPFLRNLIMPGRIDKSLDPKTCDLLPDSWQLHTRADLDRYSIKAPELQVDPDSVAYIIFTSGSTGTPKGVVVGHRTAVNLIEWVNKSFSVFADDQLLFTTSLSFDLSVYDVFGTLAAGASLRIASRQELDDTAVLFRLLCQPAITIWDSAPAMLQQLVPLFPTAEFEEKSNLRLVLLSGDWIPVGLPGQVCATFDRARVVSLGGATEATIWSNFFLIDEVAPDWTSIPYGKPIQNARYYVLNHRLLPCLEQVPGQLFIGGECLCYGYFNQPALTASRFLPDPFAEKAGGRMYHTGDLASHRHFGLEFLGRADNQVKIRGFRIELGEIEAVLGKHPAVREVVVLAREDQPGNKRLVGYVVLNENHASSEDLTRHASLYLPEYMVPTAMVILDLMPMTSNKKVDRKALPMPERVCQFVAPRTELEENLVAIWAEVLETDRIGVCDNFFELGGHSLQATRIVARLTQAFPIELNLRDLFGSPTIEGLARIIEQGMAEAELDEEREEMVL